MIKLVLTDMDDTLIPAGHDGASDYAIEGIHAMQATGLHFGPVSGRQPSAMGWMFKNRSECFSTGAFCNGQVMFVDGEVVAFGRLSGARDRRYISKSLQPGR